MKRTLHVLTAGVLLAAFLAPCVMQAQSTIKPTLSYQAHVTALDQPNVTLTARLYRDPTGLDPVWEEITETTVQSGVVNLQLGSTSALPTDHFADGLYLGISINGGEELRPLTHLTAVPLALTVPDGSISKSKIGTDYIESITINGHEIKSRAGTLNIQTGKGIVSTIDPGTGAVLLAGSSSTHGKGGFGTLADQVVDGNLTVNGNTDLGGTAANPTITFTAKAASNLDMNNFDLANVSTIEVQDSLSLSGAASLLSLQGSYGTAGQVLSSNGSASTPSWITLPSSWGTQGSSGTTPGTDYIGTADDQPLEIHVHHDGDASEGRQRALRIEPTWQSPNLIGGHNANYVDGGMVGATIGGGGNANAYNYVYRSYGTIGGGRGNMAGNLATIGGGEYNEATNTYATVGGGYGNRAANTQATVGGGYNNYASRTGTTIGGGEDNQARGSGSTIAGGLFNVAWKASNTIAGGQFNTTDAVIATVGGGEWNTADGSYAVVGGGQNNWASGLASVISGGMNNSVNGHYTTIVGGRNLSLGTSSFGFNGDNSGTQTTLSSAMQMAYFGNVDLMLGNVDGVARSARFYGPNTSYDYSTAYYTSFKAPSLSANVEYTLPSAQGAANAVLSNDGSGMLSWTVLSLTGDVTGPLGATSIQTVGGQSASDIAAATVQVLNATSSDIGNTLVKRDALGDFSANVITADLNGNAATVTNGVYTTGSYADPSWITSLSVTKITGLTIPDSVRKAYEAVSAQTANTATTATTATTASSVTNGVYTTGSYADPSWITSLSASKITGLGSPDSVRKAYEAVSAQSATTATSATSATSATTATTAGSFTGSLAGDVTGTQSATVVSQVGGVSAANVATGATAANNATSANTPSRIVARDASGNVSAGTVTAATGLVATTGGVVLQAGPLVLSSASVASANAGVNIPTGAAVVRITSGATANFNYTFPSGTEGQVLYIFNNNASNRKANNAIATINDGEMKTFIYLNGDWRLAL